MRFTVTYGTETAVVDAANEADAWSFFCSKNPFALKHPNAFPRSVTVLEDAVEVPAITETVVETVAPTLVMEDIPTPVVEESVTVAGVDSVETVVETTPDVVAETPTEAN